MEIEEEKGSSGILYGNLLPLNPAYPKISIQKEQTIIGRRRDCDFRIYNLKVSGRHALISFELSTEEFRIQDLSTNGTWVNDQRLKLGTPRVLAHGDELSFLPPSNADQSEEGLYSVSGISYIFHDLTQQLREHLVVEMEEAGIEQHYQFLKPLGQGSFGEVWLTKKIGRDNLCAAKVMCKKKYVGLTGNLESIFDEVKILSRLSHPNVCAILDSYESPRYLVLMLELAAEGDLGGLINAHPSGMPDPLAKSCFSQIIEALRYLHSKDIAHRDLKPDNVLIHGKLNSLPLLKLTDFGLSRLLGNSSVMRTVCGTPFYLAPEIIQYEINEGSRLGYNKKVDLWSAGVILYQLLTGQLPVQTGEGAKPLHRQIMEVLHPEFHLPLPAQASVPAGEALQRLLVRPSERWDAVQASNCTWLRPQKDLKRASTTVRSSIAREATVDAAVGSSLGGLPLIKVPSAPSLSRDISNLKRTKRIALDKV